MENKELDDKELLRRLIRSSRAVAIIMINCENRPELSEGDGYIIDAMNKFEELVELVESRFDFKVDRDLQ